MSQEMLWGCSATCQSDPSPLISGETYNPSGAADSIPRLTTPLHSKDLCCLATIGCLCLCSKTTALPIIACRSSSSGFKFSRAATNGSKVGDKDPRKRPTNNGYSQLFLHRISSRVIFRDSAANPG
ncbi:UNVERIFIED_CONTAM: hypothetical protein K2H54_005375 [Gekko kuhli]